MFFVAELWIAAVGVKWRQMAAYTTGAVVCEVMVIGVVI